MTARGPRSVRNLLQSGNISRISGEAAARRKLAAEVRQALPEPEAEHVVSASIDDAGQLVIGVDSSAWAARLRYTVQNLLGKPVRIRVTAPGAESDSEKE